MECLPPEAARLLPELADEYVNYLQPWLVRAAVEVIEAHFLRQRRSESSSKI